MLKQASCEQTLLFQAFVLCRHAGNEYKNEDMELTAEHYAELPDVICLEDFDRGKQGKNLLLLLFSVHNGSPSF